MLVAIGVNGRLKPQWADDEKRPLYFSPEYWRSVQDHVYPNVCKKKSGPTFVTSMFNFNRHHKASQDVAVHKVHPDSLDQMAQQDPQVR